MTNTEIMSKSEAPPDLPPEISAGLSVLRASDFFRHSSFVIRHSHALDWLRAARSGGTTGSGRGIVRRASDARGGGTREGSDSGGVEGGFPGCPGAERGDGRGAACLRAGLAGQIDRAAAGCADALG